MSEQCHTLLCFFDCSSVGELVISGEVKDHCFAFLSVVLHLAVACPFIDFV